MAEISIARSAAHAMLLAVEAGLGHSDDLLRDDPLMARMSDADRRLTTTLVLGVLRWQISLDQSIRASLSKPQAKLDPAVLAALRLGAFQLLHLDRIPAHAAINESVELTKRSGLRSAAGLVNAVLRKIGSAAGDTKSLISGQEAEKIERALAPAALAAHPAWLVERWTKFFGPDTAGAICVFDQSEPVHTVRFASPEVESEVIESGGGLAPGNLLTAARIVASGSITHTLAFHEGRVRFQDEGSQLVAELAASVSKESKRILDTCAAPGGKTLILAERNPDAQIVACEASRSRLKQLRERLAGFGHRVECRLADATVLTFDSEFDLALADVPCSGTGTLGRNPEIRYRLQPEDLPRQAERQRAILRCALRAVRPDGRVVYSTCSLEPEENEQVIASAISEGSGARIIPLGTELEQMRDHRVLTHDGADRLKPCLTPEGFLRLLPGALGTDGFFIAMLEKPTPALPS
jgi:16S rRNA (cytosine967-C5)-methyltransferase